MRGLRAARTRPGTPVPDLAAAVKRALHPSLNPTGIGSAIAAIYAAVVMVWNASNHHGVISPPVIVAALSAAAFLFARGKVTPVADPRDGNGQPLTAAPAALTLPSYPIPPAAPPEPPAPVS